MIDIRLETDAGTYSIKGDENGITVAKLVRQRTGKLAGQEVSKGETYYGRMDQAVQRVAHCYAAGGDHVVSSLEEWLWRYREMVSQLAKNLQLQQGK
jgi:hypothetical protein